MHVLWLLRHLGLDPASAEARRAVDLVRERVTWRGSGPPEANENPFFAGEVKPCINGQVATAGAYFVQDVQGIADGEAEQGTAGAIRVDAHGEDRARNGDAITGPWGEHATHEHGTTRR